METDALFDPVMGGMFRWTAPVFVVLAAEVARSASVEQAEFELLLNARACYELNSEDCEKSLRCVAPSPLSVVDPESVCWLNVEYVKNMWETDCRLESKGNLLSIARDLERLQTLSSFDVHQMRLRTSSAYACNVASHSLASLLIRRHLISFDETSEWQDLSHWEKTLRVLSV